MTRKPSAKSERIFKQNFYGAINHMERWGVDEPFDAWGTVCNRDDEYICRRTIDDVLAICDKHERELNWQIRHGFEPWKSETIQRKALRITRNTCENWIKREAEIEAECAAMWR